MDHILVTTLGTYCDSLLMDNAISELAKTHKIVYLTDKNHKLPEDFIKVTFETPSFFTNDPKIKIANTNRSFTWWAVTHPDKVYEAYNWSTVIKRKMRKILKTYDIKSIHILYPAMGMLWLMPKIDIPTYIYYYAPGVLSKTLPWIFDSILKDKHYKLYAHKNADYNKESGLTYLERISRYSVRQESIHEMLKSVNHVISWDKEVLPELDYVYKDLNILYAGALLTPDINKKDWPIDNSVNDFIKRKKQIIFMSFGSYGDSTLLEKIVPKLIKKLTIYCKENNAGLIYHNGNIENTEHILSINGFIQYEYIVPKSSLIIFTGSACLQNICLYNCVPMLFVPLLTEQFFWARNYKHFTKKQYIDYQEERIPQSLDFDSLMEKTDYLKKVSSSMHKNNSAQRVSGFLS